MEFGKTLALSLAFCALLPAVEPHKSAGEYPAHAESAAADIGVDFQVHSYSADGQMYFTKDYLVCEVAVYPRAQLELTGSSFALRINRSKNLVQEASPEFVAASLKYPDWTQHPQLELGAGVGDAGVTVGAPAPAGRFPGDPAAGISLPRRPEAPEDPHKIEKPRIDAAKLALDTALKTGLIATPVAGNIYFEYSGNMKKVKNLSLIVRAAGVDLEIPLR